MQVQLDMHRREVKLSENSALRVLYAITGASGEKGPTASESRIATTGPCISSTHTRITARD